MSETLNVYVHNQPAGALTQEQGEYIFNYAHSAAPRDFVSLTMPTRSKGYVLPFLHPVFEMHLPEGYLLALIKKQFTKLTATDDFGLLSLLAPNIRGRIQYQPAANSAAKPLELDDLLHPTRGLFEDLVQRFALRSALSGVQPKVLAQIENKATLKLDDYIVKAWGPDYPELALNEYCCMLAVRHAGIPVPEFHLSEDHSLFIMKRFDLTSQGEALGFEDMCVLQAKQRDDKYTGSCEQLAKTIKSFCSPAHKQASLQQYFKMTVLNHRLQNGDAHLKNFGLIYENTASVRLAPAYDIVSTTAYIKKDIAALTLLGSKKWWSKEYLIHFGTQACDLTHKQANDLYLECEHALAETNIYINQRMATASNPDQVHLLQHLAQLTTPKAQ
ncbi:MAG: type II toxin-antitoxin system HipA family toxin [Natronospirillum sp.]